MIKLVSLYTPNIASFAKHTEEINRRYCKKRGYDIEINYNVINDSRPPAWSKIPMLMREMIFMNPEDIIVWIDADAAVLDHDKRIEDYCFRDINLAGLDETLNCGVMIFKVSPFSYQALSEMWRRTKFINHPWWENAALNEMYSENWQNIKDKISVIDFKLINSFHPGVYEPGDFIAHMPAEPEGAREFFFKQINESQKKEIG